MNYSVYIDSLSAITIGAIDSPREFFTSLKEADDHAKKLQVCVINDPNYTCGGYENTVIEVCRENKILFVYQC